MFCFFRIIATLCIRISLINLPKQLFIIKPEALLETDPFNSLKLKANSLRDRIFHNHL